MILNDFTLNPYLLFPIFALLVNIYLFFAIFRKKTSDKATQWFLIYTGINILANIVNIPIHLVTNAVDATFWYRFFQGVSGWSFATLPIFALYYVKRDKLAQNIWLRAFLFAFPLFSSFISFATDLMYSRNVSDATNEHLMWIVKAGPFYQQFYLLWFHLFIIVSCVILFLYAKKLKDKKRKIQTYIFIAAFPIQIFISVSLVLILPNILGTPLLPEGAFLGSIAGTIIGFAILKFDLFTVNPSTVANNIVSTMNESLFVFNTEGVLLFVNEAAENNLGYARTELEGQYIKDILRDKWDEFRKSIIQPILENKTQNDIEGILYKKDGSKLQVGFSASPVFEANHITGIVCVATDISYISKIYDITAERNKMNAIIESTVDGIFALDKTGLISQVNRSAALMVEKSEEVIRNKLLEDGFNFMADNKRLTSSDILVMVRQGQIDAKKEYKLKTTTGKEKTIQLTVTPLRKNQPELVEAIITLHDMTEERELEAMKVDFVSMAAHELRTPLTSVKGYLSIYLTDYGKDLNQDQTMLIQRAVDSANRLSDLTESLLNYTKMEKEGININPKPNDLNAVIKRVLEESKNNLTGKNITFNYSEPTTAIPNISFDEMRIGEVLTNLLSNAFKYSNENTEVDVKVELDKNEVKVFVKDQGLGIPADSIPRLFTKFYRVPNKLEQTARGTGLGLYIAKQIIEKHHGKIWVDSVEDKGSTFAFSLPI